MKKQKKPIFLVLGLAALCGVVAFMNKPTSTGPDQPTPAAQQEESKKDVGSATADLIKKDTPAKPPEVKKPKMMAHRGGVENVPLILKVKVTPQKPKMNESSTAAQWYETDSAHNTPIK